MGGLWKIADVFELEENEHFLRMNNCGHSAPLVAEVLVTLDLAQIVMDNMKHLDEGRIIVHSDWKEG